jgi:hypothetical protein
MAKFDLGLKAGLSAGAAEGREQWGGELPPTGSYSGVLKILSMGVIGPNAQNAGKPKLQIGVELRDTPDKKYDGYLAWGGLNLIESSIPYINQFLISLTDGTDAEFAKIKKAMYDDGPIVDEKKKHVLKIGNWNIASPNGELPIKVSISNKPYFNSATGVTTQSVRIESYLIGGGSASVGGAKETVVIADEPELDLLDDEDDLLV